MMIQGDYGILVSFRVEISGPSERMTMGSMTHMVLHEDMLGVVLRFRIPTIVTKLLRWYQVAPMQLVPNIWWMIIEFFYQMIESGKMTRTRIFKCFFQLKHSSHGCWYAS